MMKIQVPNFRGSKDKLHEFEHLQLNPLRPPQNRITDEPKLHFFRSFSCDEAIDFWQTMRITPDTTLKNVLQKHRNKFAKNDFKEVSKFKCDQLVYDPSKDDFSDFMRTLKKTATCYTSVWGLDRLACENAPIWRNTSPDPTSTFNNRQNRGKHGRNQNI